jgi:hypothetical protein
MSTPAEPSAPDAGDTIERRLAEVYAGLVHRLQWASEAARRGHGYSERWHLFAVAARGWLLLEREVLFPAIDRTLPLDPERRRLCGDHATLRRLLEDCTAAVDSDGADAVAEAVQETLFTLHRHGVRTRRRYGVLLDRTLGPSARHQLLQQLRLPSR